jgi:hypothetical protein
MSIEKYSNSLLLKPVLRKATDTDIKLAEINLKDAQFALEICEAEVKKLNLDMNLISCEYTLDKSKVLFSYLADDRVDFLFRAEIAGINRVEGDTFPLPVVRDGLQLIGQIPAGKPFEQGMRAEHRGRQDDRFNPHGGQNRQRHRQRAFAEAGDVLNCEYSLHVCIPPF